MRKGAKLAPRGAAGYNVQAGAQLLVVMLLSLVVSYSTLYARGTCPLYYILESTVFRRSSLRR